MSGHDDVKGVAALASMCALAACSSIYSGNTRGEQVADWAKRAGLKSSVGTLERDWAAVARAFPSKNASLVRSVCDVLVTDALRANEQLPAPDSGLTNSLAAAYQHEAQAGKACFSDPTGAAAREQSAQEQSSAATYLIKAQARYDALVSGVAGI